MTKTDIEFIRTVISGKNLIIRQPFNPPILFESGFEPDKIPNGVKIETRTKRDL